MPNDDQPSGAIAAITPSDNANLTAEADGCRAVYCGVTGDIALVPPGGTAVVFKNVPAGTVLPVRAIRINSTNTTATDLVALF